MTSLYGRERFGYGNWRVCEGRKERSIVELVRVRVNLAAWVKHFLCGATREDQFSVLLEIQEEFVCLDGVDVEKLLRASRLALLDHASPLGVNVLVDEQYVSHFFLNKTAEHIS